MEELLLKYVSTVHPTKINQRGYKHLKKNTVFEGIVVHFYSNVPFQDLNADNLTSSLLIFFTSTPHTPFLPLCHTLFKPQSQALSIATQTLYF